MVSSGLGDQLSGDHLSFQWQNILKPMEKDLADTRIYSTITYYSETDGFDELGERSTRTETEIFGSACQMDNDQGKILSLIVHRQE